MYELELANPDARSEAMSLAAQYREEGMSPSEALTEAWAEVRDGDDDDEDEDDIDLDVLPQSRRKSNPEDASGIGLLALVGLGGYLLWCFFASTGKGLPWSWRPWSASMGRRPRIVQRRPPQQIGSMEPVYQARDITEESVHLIVP